MTTFYMKKMCRALVFIVAISVVTGIPAIAWAAADLGGMFDLFKTQLSDLAPLISAVCWIGGFILMVSGGMKLKAHGEDPSKEKLGPGVARLLLGVFLVALPFMSSILTTTVGVNTGTVATYKDLTQTF